MPQQNVAALQISKNRCVEGLTVDMTFAFVKFNSRPVYNLIVRKTASQKVIMQQLLMFNLKIYQPKKNNSK